LRGFMRRDWNDASTMALYRSCENKNSTCSGMINATQKDLGTASLPLPALVLSHLMGRGYSSTGMEVKEASLPLPALVLCHLMGRGYRSTGMKAKEAIAHHLIRCQCSVCGENMATPAVNASSTVGKPTPQDPSEPGDQKAVMSDSPPGKTGRGCPLVKFSNPRWLLSKCSLISKQNLDNSRKLNF
jgi:hypothetical protein